MGEYTGRATFGILLDATWGGLFLSLTILLLLSVHEWSIGTYAFITFTGTFTAVLFVHLYFAVLPKKLVINEMGVFLYRGKRLWKKEYWSDIKRIVSSAFPGKYPRVGFAIYGNGVLEVNNRDVLGPKEVLKKAFREIAEIASDKNIVIDDGLGWAPGIVGGLEEVDVQDYAQRWYKTKKINTKIWVYLSIFLFIGGLLAVSLALILPELAGTSLILGVLFILFGILIAVSAVYEIMYYPDEIYFDDAGIKTKSPSGKVREIPWYIVRNVACVERTGLVTICDILRNCITAKVDPKVCKALKIMFRRHKN